MDLNDIEMVEDLVKSAVNAAVAKNQAETKERMSEMMGGMNIPGLDKLGPMLGVG